MKKKTRVRLSSLKQGDYFRLTPKGPVYMKDEYGDGQVVFGRGLGRTWLARFSKYRLIYQANIKIVEEK